MGSFYFQLGLTVVFQLLRQVVKDPDSREKMKGILLQLRDTINAAYADDPDFAK